MEPRSNLIKSKSSNSAITTKSGLRERDTTRSDLQFQRNVIKKRGVYVENKATKTRITSPERNPKQELPVKPPPRPRAGRKKFLASVLTILSKSTAATQYPDDIDNDGPKIHRKPTRKRPESAKNPEVYDTHKKKKFRSKILSNGVGKDEKEQQIIVLKPQNEMPHSSSLFFDNENESMNFSYLPALVKNAQQYMDKDVAGEDNVYNNMNNSLMKEILEGKQMKKDKKVRIDDPTTVVGLSNIKTQANDDNKGLYNFFVDLLENIGIYDDPKTAKNAELSSNASSSKFPLEINESVAKKLEISCHSPTCGRSRSPSPRNRFYCFRDDDEMSKANQDTPTVAKVRKPIRNRRPVKAQSFSVATKPQPKKMKTESFTLSKKASRKRKKQTLFNMFKEELKMDDSAFEEPQNLYEALKVIADNKRKCQTTIHFEEKMRKNRRDYGFPECMFKRPKVFTPGKKKKSKKINEPIVKQQSEIRSYGRSVRTNGYTTDVSNGSQFSLKVFGYDYERPKVSAERPVKEVVFTFHSSPSSSDRGLGSNDDDLDYTDGYFSTFSHSPPNDFELN